MKTIGIENSKSSVQAHLTLGTKTMGLGIYGAYLALAIIYFWFGGMKFTHYEAEGLVAPAAPELPSIIRIPGGSE